LALIVLAAVGVGAVAAFLTGARASITPLAPVAASAALALGIAISWPALPFDRRASTEISDVRTASEHLALATPAIVAETAAGFLLPSRDLSRFAVETYTSLRRAINSYALLLNDGPSGLRAGQILFHDAAADRPVALYNAFEIDDQAAVAGNSLVRLE